MSNMILITPKQEGLDRVQYIGHHEKGELDYFQFGHTVQIGEYHVMGRVNVGASTMTRVITGSAQMYSVLDNLLQHPQEAYKVRAEFYDSWQALVAMAGMKGVVTMLLLCADGRVRLFTFNSHQDLEVVTFTVPTLYNMGMILTEATIRVQVDAEHQRRLVRLSQGFDENSNAVVDLDDFN